MLLSASIELGQRQAPRASNEMSFLSCKVYVIRDWNQAESQDCGPGISELGYGFSNCHPNAYTSHMPLGTFTAIFVKCPKRTKQEINHIYNIDFIGK